MRKVILDLISNNIYNITKPIAESVNTELPRMFIQRYLCETDYSYQFQTLSGLYFNV